MAVNQAHAAFTEEEISLFRLRTIMGSVSKEVVHQVFEEDVRDKPPSLPLFQFYEKRGVPLKKFKGNLDSKQIAQLIRDPGGKSFDITLLYKVLHWGSAILANKSDDKWREGNDSLESFLTTVKNKRNALFHDEPKFTKRELIDYLEELRKILTRIIELTGTLYGIPKTDIDERIATMNNEINVSRDRPLTPKNFDDYKKQLLFKEQSEFVRSKGRAVLSKPYGEWVILSPLSLLHKFNVKVDMLFTEMELLDDTEPEKSTKIAFRDILEGVDYKIKDPVILIEGIAGVGKTTLTKKILNDWISRRSKMKELSTYDLLLYTECRDHTIRSFKELIKALMPEISSSFQDEDLLDVILDQKVIVIFDGLDELSTSSMNLLHEVLQLKKKHRLTVFATTRPEKLEYYLKTVHSLQIRTKHIKLLGIPMSKRNEFVTKYHNEMKNAGYSEHDIASLLEFLDSTAVSLGDLWMLPYNLISLITIFVDDPTAVLSITTAPELYWKIYQLICGKVIERLKQNETTRGLPESSLRKKLEHFNVVLCKESLESLKNDNINLPEEVYDRLVHVCDQEDIPSDEMIGAYLKTVVKTKLQGRLIQRSFPHKGLQEFLGALRIFKEIVNKDQFTDVDETKKKLENCCKSLYLPSDLIQKIMQLTDEGLKLHSKDAATSGPDGTLQKTTVIKDMLQNAHGSSPLDMTKYQNLLITLIGMFSLEPNHISKSIKRETLELLREAGVRYSSQWLQILKAVKCDEYVASFISNTGGILKDVTTVDDSSLLAYTKLLQALKNPHTDKNNVNFDLDIKGEFSNGKELLKALSQHDFTVREMFIYDKSISSYTTMMRNLQEPLKNAKDVNIYLDTRGECSSAEDLMALLIEIDHLQFKVVKVKIMDGDFEKYKSLLKDLMSVMRHKHAVKLYISSNSPAIGAFLQEINKYKFSVSQLHDYYQLKYFTTDLTYEKEIMKMMIGGEMNAYTGALTADMRLPQSLKTLRVSVVNGDAYARLCDYLENKWMYKVEVALPPQMNSCHLKPSPKGFVLFLPDVDEQLLEETVRKVKTVTNRRALQYIYFPRCSLSQEGLFKLLENLRSGYNMALNFVFPLAMKLSSELLQLTQLKNVFWEDEEKIWQWDFDDDDSDYEAQGQYKREDEAKMWKGDVDDSDDEDEAADNYYTDNNSTPDNEEYDYYDYAYSEDNSREYDFPDNEDYDDDDDY